MNTYCDESVQCILCGGKKHRVFQRAEEPFNVLKCDQCGFVFVHPYPEESLLVGHYHEESYYRDWIDRQMPQRLYMWKNRLKDLLKYKRQGALLDVGCGIGTFIQLAKEKGFEVCGTEVSQYACAYIEEKYGIDVFQGYLEQARYPDCHFDVVTLWHVLEHLRDPKSILKEVRRILKPDGLFVVAVPNVNNLFMQTAYPLARRKPFKFFSIDDKELHLSHFSDETLKKILEQSGFQCVGKRPDMAQIGVAKQCLDYTAYLTYLLTRKNFSSALRMYAIKSHETIM